MKSFSLFVMNIILFSLFVLSIIYVIYGPICKKLQYKIAINNAVVKNNTNVMTYITYNIDEIGVNNWLIVHGIIVLILIFLLSLYYVGYIKKSIKITVVIIILLLFRFIWLIIGMIIYYSCNNANEFENLKVMNASIIIGYFELLIYFSFPIFLYQLYFLS